MATPALDEILRSLDIDIQAIALCSLRGGLRLVSTPETSVVVHYILSGAMHLEVGEDGPLVFQAGSIVVVPAGLEQAISATPETQDSVLAADRVRLGAAGMVLVDGTNGDAVDLRFACGTISAQLPALSALFGATVQPFSEDLSDVCFVQQAFALILREIEGDELGARALASALMKSCLVLMIRRRWARRPEAGDSAFHHPKVGKAISAIVAKPAWPHSVASLASEAGMSRSGFARVFQDVAKVTPMVFVAQARLARGSDLLRSTELPVKAIASAVGFSSRSHFSSSFRAAYGLDPTQYRRSDPSDANV